LGDFGTITVGLGEERKEWTSFRNGLAGDDARFNRFFSNWWFGGLVDSLIPEPLELSMLQPPDDTGGGGEEEEGAGRINVQSTTHRKNTLDRRQQKHGPVSPWFFSSLPVGDAHPERSFIPVVLHSVG
jgi:hypothetical protein